MSMLNDIVMPCGKCVHDGRLEYVDENRPIAVMAEIKRTVYEPGATILSETKMAQ